MATSTLPRLLDINELAEHLGTSQRHIRRLIAERRIPNVKVTRSKRIFELSEYCVDGGGVGD